MEKRIIIGESTNLLTLDIYTKDGKNTGESLTINLKDIELLDRLQKVWDENTKNKNWINAQLTIIDKKQDFRKKGQIMSNNEKMKYDALKTFYKRQREVYELFLGKDGVKKLLYGRPFEWETLIEIENIISKQIAPYLDITMDNITKEIKQKYNVDIKNSKEVLKADE